ncbi:MAG: epoxide hydrolase family protein [Pseudomonadota bacterium]
MTVSFDRPPEAFKIEIAEDVLVDIRARISAFPWFDEPEDGGWHYGAHDCYLRALADHWVNRYNWRDHERDLNRFSHFKAEIGGWGLHFVHQKSPRPDATPLILILGWPGSFLEFSAAIPKLTNPKRPGDPAFHVVAPSLPGYVFSDVPKRPVGPRATAAHFDMLMRALGYDRYMAQGGDWGSVITGWMGFDHPAHCRAIHLNAFGLRPRDMSAEGEGGREWLKQAIAIRKLETAYLTLQATKPQSLAYAMMDSPVGIATWLVEKFRTWMDRTPRDSGDPVDRPFDGPPLSFDEMITHIMLYVATKRFHSATWLYRGFFEERSNELPTGSRVEVPTGIANFPKDLMTFPTPEMVARAYRVVHRTQMPRGGHFAALEEPDLFTEDVRAFATKVAGEFT